MKHSIMVAIHIPIVAVGLVDYSLFHMRWNSMLTLVRWLTAYRQAPDVLEQKTRGSARWQWEQAQGSSNRKLVQNCEGSQFEQTLKGPDRSARLRRRNSHTRYANSLCKNKGAQSHMGAAGKWQDFLLGNEVTMHIHPGSWKRLNSCWEKLSHVHSLLAWGMEMHLEVVQFLSGTWLAVGRVDKGVCYLVRQEVGSEVLKEYWGDLYWISSWWTKSIPALVGFLLFHLLLCWETIIHPAYAVWKDSQGKFSRYLGYAHRFLMALLGFYYLYTNFISIYGWDAWGFSGPDCHYLHVEAVPCWKVLKTNHIIPKSAGKTGAGTLSSFPLLLLLLLCVGVIML